VCWVSTSVHRAQASLSWTEKIYSVAAACVTHRSRGLTIRMCVRRHVWSIGRQLLDSFKTQILDGRATADIVLEELRVEVSSKRSLWGRSPRLGVILAGDCPQSRKYVEIKNKAAEYIGIECVNLYLDEDEKRIEREVLNLVQDDSIDGVLVQLPLPRNVSQDKILSLVPAEKDVDGFHPQNLGLLALQQLSTLRPWEKRFARIEEREERVVQESRYEGIVPCTAKAVISLLDRFDIQIKGKKAVVLGRSSIAGLPITLLMMHRGSLITNCDLNSSETLVKRVCQEADIIVSAAGCPSLIDSSWLKSGVVLVDVGFNVLEGGSVCGDVNFDEVMTSGKASWITPVPGGIGPMTVAMLMDNTIQNATRNLSPETLESHPRFKTLDDLNL